MLPFLKKKDDEAIAPPKPVAINRAGSYHEFIPYYCHYNPTTLLTKNGELLQIIKIATNTRGLEYEGASAGAGKEDTSVRETVRRAILKNINEDSFACWLHTVRKRKSISIKGDFREKFAGYVHEQWMRKHRWKYQYYNEVYLTILHDGKSAKMIDKSAFRKTVTNTLNRAYHGAHLEATAAKLDNVVNGMLATINQHYNAKRLGLEEHIPTSGESLPPLPIVYSEMMEFLGTLINLRAEPCPLPDVDLSTVMVGKSLTFGFNALETRNSEGKRRFAAILALKQYRELPLETADRMLQAPMEFIISQSFSFLPHQNALKQYKEQREIFEISGDNYSIGASGIEDMVKSHKKRPTDFGEHQASIMVIADDYKLLDSEIATVQDAFPELGLVTIREDIKLEESFWSILPGNFEFLRRQTPINTIRTAGFTRLNRFPLGTGDGNHWGSAVTIIPTTVNSPYFFNFHHQDNGHSVLFDFNSFSDHAGHILINFLISESRKFGGRLIVFDKDHSARLLFSKLGGAYYSLPAKNEGHEEGSLQLNPFTLEDSPRNKSFLLAWCNSLISPETRLDDAQRQILQDALEQLYAQPPEERHLAAFAAIVKTVDPKMAYRLQTWQKNGALAHVFEGTSEMIEMRNPMQAFDITAACRKPDCVIPVFSYLLHRVISSVDGRPTVLVLHDAWDLLENAFFAPRLESLMGMLRQNNVMVIFTCSRPADCAGSHIMTTIMEGCATQLFVPDDLSLDYTKQHLGLNEYDSRMLRQMERQKGEFLIKQNGESIALKASLDSMDDIYAVMDNDKKSLVAQADKLK
jgi:type IV secretion system protein VirB4